MWTLYLFWHVDILSLIISSLENYWTHCSTLFWNFVLKFFFKIFDVTMHVILLKIVSSWAPTKSPFLISFVPRITLFSLWNQKPVKIWYAEKKRSERLISWSTKSLIDAVGVWQLRILMYVSCSMGWLADFTELKNALWNHVKLYFLHHQNLQTFIGEQYQSVGYFYISCIFAVLFTL